jgi:hypothetical protein
VLADQFYTIVFYVGKFMGSMALCGGTGPASVGLDEFSRRFGKGFVTSAVFHGGSSIRCLWASWQNAGVIFRTF